MPSAPEPVPALRDRAERHVFAALPELPAVERRLLALLEPAGEPLLLERPVEPAALEPAPEPPALDPAATAVGGETRLSDGFDGPPRAAPAEPPALEAPMAPEPMGEPAAPDPAAAPPVGR